MNRVWKMAVLASLLAFLSACATTHILENKPFHPDSDDAVLLIGLLSGEKAIIFNEEHQTGGIFLRDMRRPEKPFQEMSIYAFRHPIGKSFKIVRIVIPGAFTGTTLYHQEAVLSNTPLLTPEKAGIYYYGTVVHSVGLVSINDQQKPQLLKLAREKYKNIFEKLPPINFK